MKRNVLVLLVLWCLASSASKQEAPSWVTEAATRPIPAYSGKVPAAVLINEQRVTVDASGMVDTITRHAVKILNHEGKNTAEVVEEYAKNGRQVKELHAWLVAPGGFIKTFEKGSVEDIGSYGDELYNDFRFRRIKADNPEIGAVFVYESEVVEKPNAAQDLFWFQVGLPEIESRYSVTVPAGWTASGTLLNHAPITPTVNGNTYTWTLKYLPFREEEVGAPQLRGTAPLLAVDFHPPVGFTDPPAFKNWPDVSRWHTALASAQSDVSPELAAKVRELTSGAANEYAKIRALGEYVQKVRYVEIAMDLAHNGGYRPHPASEVFVKQYGDCKDKANLLRAMLKAVGIPSYLVAIYSGDRTHVKKDWASPYQFNHMIIAIQVSDALKTPTVIDSTAGRLLIFDPTDYLTPMGDLPFYEQGSYALICAGAKGDIAQMPVIPPDSNSMRETVEATLDPTGKLTGSLALQAQGQAGRNERMRHNVPPDKYKSEMERYFAYYSKGAAITKLQANDDFEQDRFTANFDFASDQYAQLMQNRMLVFNPSITEPSARHYPTEKERLEPIVLNGRVYQKKVSIQLPAGFTVDELPSAYHAEAPFAQFKIDFRQDAGHLIVEEELRTEAVTLPASDYVSVKKFFDNVLGANNQQAVVIKN